MVAYVKTETTTENAATGIYKTKESEALTTKPKEAELLTCQQPTLRQIRERAVTKNATKLLTFNYNNMKTILDKINKADEIQAKKVELGKHEVELGSIDNLNKLLEEIKGAGRNIAQTGRKSVSALVNTTFPLIDSTRKKIEQAKKDYEIILKQTKDLGIEIPANVTANIKNAIAEESDLLELRKSIEKYQLQYLDLTDNF